MTIFDYSSIAPISTSRLAGTALQPVSTTGTGETSFSDLLSQAINNIESLNAESERLTIATALGEPVELHQVMLAGTKAQLAMELFIEVRNRLIEAYQEISRMPV